MTDSSYPGKLRELQQLNMIQISLPDAHVHLVEDVEEKWWLDFLKRAHLYDEIPEGCSPSVQPRTSESAWTDCRFMSKGRRKSRRAGTRICRGSSPAGKRKESERGGEMHLKSCFGTELYRSQFMMKC